MNYGYLRVSTDKQDLDNQRNAILNYANKCSISGIEFIQEIISSRKTDRKIFELIDKLKAGDNLIVFELSRLARSMRELESIRVKIADKNATIHAISQNLTITPDGYDIATQALIFALSLSAQIERQMISERTTSALQARKAAGMKLGRPAGYSKLDNQREEIEKYLKLGINVSATAKLINCSRTTLTNWLKTNKDSLNLN